MLHHQAGPDDVAAGDAGQSEIGRQPGEMRAKRLAIGNATADQDAPFRCGSGVPGEEQAERSKPQQRRNLTCRGPNLLERDQIEDEGEQQRADAQANEPGAHSAPL